MDLMSQKTWRFINTFAPWLSALGTITAVLVALYLARMDRRIQLEVSAGHRITLHLASPGPPPEYLLLGVRQCRAP